MNNMKDEANKHHFELRILINCPDQKAIVAGDPGHLVAAMIRDHAFYVDLMKARRKLENAISAYLEITTGVKFPHFPEPYVQR